MLLWLSSVCWVIKLNTPKWDILATGVAVYFESKLRKLKLQTYQSISPAKVREKPPAEVENRENEVCGRENSLHLLRMQKRRKTTIFPFFLSADVRKRTTVRLVLPASSSSKLQQYTAIIFEKQIFTGWSVLLINCLDGVCNQ